MRRPLLFAPGFLVLVISAPATAQPADPAPPDNTRKVWEASWVFESGIPSDCRFFADPVAATGDRFTGALGLYLLQPRFERNLAYSVNVSSSMPGAAIAVQTVQGNDQDFHYGLSASPLLTFGYESEDGFGFRGRWFRFDQIAGVTVLNRLPANAPPGETIQVASAAITTAQTFGNQLFSVVSAFQPGPNVVTFGSRLLVENWDLEATQAFDHGTWRLQLASGARYTHLAQNYGASNTGPNFGSAGLFEVAVRSGHSFNGVGPTVAVEASRRLGNSGLSVYGSARGAVLFGSGRQHTTTNNFGEIIDSSSRHQDLLPMLDAEVGVEYGREAGVFYPFLRAGFVGQTYFGAGSAASEDGNLGLIGLSLTVGTRF